MKQLSNIFYEEGWGNLEKTHISYESFTYNENNSEKPSQ